MRGRHDTRCGICQATVALRTAALSTAAAAAAVSVPVGERATEIFVGGQPATLGVVAEKACPGEHGRDRVHRVGRVSCVRDSNDGA